MIERLKLNRVDETDKNSESGPGFDGETGWYGQDEDDPCYLDSDVKAGGVTVRKPSS
jgi:hypothetical protein